MAKPKTDKVAPHKFGQSVLAKHAGTKNRIKFTEEQRVAGHRFFEGIVVEFTDPAMAAYFDVAFNGTEFTTAEPNVVMGEDEIRFGDPHAPDADRIGVVDPHTVIGRGREGIEPGTTVVEHLTGQPGSGRVALEAHDSGAGASSEG